MTCEDSFLSGFPPQERVKLQPSSCVAGLAIPTQGLCPLSQFAEQASLSAGLIDAGKVGCSWLTYLVRLYLLTWALGTMRNLSQFHANLVSLLME